MEEQNTYYKGYKFRIYPTEDQKDVINKLMNSYRYAYNWALEKINYRYMEYLADLSEYKNYTFIDLCHIFTEYKKSSDEQWLKDIPHTTARYAIKDAITNMNTYFKSHSGKPKFKSKKGRTKSFGTRNDRFFIEGNGVRFEGIHNKKSRSAGMIDLGFNCTQFSKNTKYYNPRISIDKNGYYYASFCILETKIPYQTPKTEPIGIDLGYRQTMVVSNGDVYNRPNKKIDKIDKQIGQIQHHISRDIERRITEAKRTRTKYEDIPKSNRALKREARYHKLLDRKHNIKINWCYGTVNSILSENPEMVVIENIDIKYMMKSQNRFARKYIAKADLAMMSNIIIHKCNQHNIPYMQASSTYPSSQICSNCGSIKDMSHGKKIYVCPNCGMVMDRDLNAAINLRNLAFSS